MTGTGVNTDDVISVTTMLNYSNNSYKKTYNSYIESTVFSTVLFLPIKVIKVQKP